MAIILLCILACSSGSLGLVLVLKMTSHCILVVGLCLRESISTIAKDRLLIKRLLLSSSHELLVLDGLHLLEGLQILVGL